MIDTFQFTGVDECIDDLEVDKSDSKVYHDKQQTPWVDEWRQHGLGSTAERDMLSFRIKE